MNTLSLTSLINGSGTPLLILHGLFGSGRNWGGVTRKLAGIRQTHALDARNHGDSPWADTMSYEEMAGDVALYIKTHGIGQCDLLGHSMGGKTAMILALTRPELIRNLVVVDIAPVPYRSEEHRLFAKAMADADLGQAKHRTDVDAQLAPVIEDPTLRAFLTQNLVGEPGNYHWRLNLNVIYREFPVLAGFPSITRPFTGKATFIAGERSHYIQPKYKPTIAALFPNAHIEAMAGSGHWPHAEQPERFVALARSALS